MTQSRRILWFAVFAAAVLLLPSRATAQNFVATGSMTTVRYEHTATLLSNGKALIAGGNSSFFAASAELYDPSTGTFSATGSMTTARFQGSTTTLLPNGQVLVARGVGLSGLLNSAELYDPSTGTFSATGPMAAGRFHHTAALLQDGRVLIAGGNAPLDHRHYRLLLLCNDERPEFRLEVHRRGDRALGRFCEHATSVARIHVVREGADDRELCSEPASESSKLFV